MVFISSNSSLWIVIISFVVTPFGATSSIVASTIGGTAGIEPEMQGLAAGLLNTSQQIGVAIGVSTASVIEFTVKIAGGSGFLATIKGIPYSFNTYHCTFPYSRNNSCFNDAIKC